MKTELIMGIPVDKLTYATVISDIPEYIENGKKMSILSINPQIVIESKKFPEIVSLIHSSTHRIPDGIGIVLVSKLTNGVIEQRVAGYDLMLKILSYADKNKCSIFLYGAKPAVLKDTLRNIELHYPNVEIKGTIDGYTSLKEKEVVTAINHKKPDFLFVALGFPKQEQWLARNIDKLHVKVFQDVGGSFDVLSGHVKRAPQVFINFHLEWLYRSLSNPLRAGRILQLPVFLVKSLKWKVRHRRDKQNN